MNIQRAGISAFKGTRNSMWSPSAKEVFGLGGQAKWNPFKPPSIMGQSLGQTAQDSYNAALPEMARFDAIKNRALRIANKTERDRIISEYGLNDPTNRDLAQYMRDATFSCVSEAQKYQPIAYEQGFPAKGPCRGRVTKLRNFNSDFESEVRAAEEQYGILPEPVIIERIVTVPGAAAQAGMTGPLPYMIAGAGLLVVLAIIGVFGKRKK